MHKGQKASKNGVQYFLCPFTDMYITQGSNSKFSHNKIMANDVRGLNVGVKYPCYAPCDLKCLKIYPESGQSMWQSIEPVHFANDRVDYATIMIAHDNNLTSKVGDIVRQGDFWGSMGDKGVGIGVHRHIQISQSKDTTWKKVSTFVLNGTTYPIYGFNNEYDLDDCYYINDTNIIYGMGGNWKMLPALLKYQAHCESIGWQEWKCDGEMAGTTGEKRRLEAIRIDYPEVEAKTHIQDDGWIDYGKITKDTIIGTTGEKKRLECLCLKGSFEYRVHIEGSGWTCWTDADGIATLGSVGQGLRIEAIEIKEK